MFTNSHNQVVRQDGAVAVIRMRINADFSPDPTHWYTSRLIYRDQDCPNKKYREKNALSNIARRDKALEVDHTSNIINEFLESDADYYKHVRDVFSENEKVNPATCSQLVFAILEGRPLSRDDLDYIAPLLNVGVDDFYQDLDILRRQLNAEFEAIDMQYNENAHAVVTEEGIEEYNAHFAKMYEAVRIKYDVLRPYYYKSNIHLFLNMYRNIVYNKLIEQQLFQIVWIKPEPNLLFDQEKHWVHIGYQKVPIGNDISLFYEYIEYHYHKTENAMFRLYSHDPEFFVHRFP